jgi:hypothetical protein
VHEDEAPFKLFLRYYACDSRDGPDYGFYSDEEDGVPTQVPSTSPDLLIKTIQAVDKDDDMMMISARMNLYYIYTV